MNQYEAMFLFDPTFGSSFDKCESEIRRLMERAQAEILFCRQWDERRLAYRIKGRKRGVYVLVYFKAPPDRIAPLERDAKLSEHILRLLVLRAEGITPEHMERAASLRGQEAKTGTEPRRQSEEVTEQDTDDVSGDLQAESEEEKVEAEAVATETVGADRPKDEGIGNGE